MPYAFHDPISFKIQHIPRLSVSRYQTSLDDIAAQLPVRILCHMDLRHFRIFAGTPRPIRSQGHRRPLSLQADPHRIASHFLSRLRTTLLLAFSHRIKSHICIYQRCFRFLLLFGGFNLRGLMRSSVGGGPGGGLVTSGIWHLQDESAILVYRMNAMQSKIQIHRAP